MTDFKYVVPVRNCEYEVNNDLITVLFKKEKPFFLEKLLFKKRVGKPVKIDLDEIGSFIWKLCDGKNNISEITKIASEHFNEKIEPATERVDLFIKQMHIHKLISLYEKK